MNIFKNLKFKIFFLTLLCLISIQIKANPSLVVAQKMKMGSSSDKICCLGRKEWVRLPKLFEDRIIAKIDSGAKTSSLHAEKINIFEKGNEEWVRFTIYPKRNSKKIKHIVELKVVEFRRVKSSNGEITNRPVVITHLSIGGKSWPIEITLFDRAEMKHRMLLGRAAFSERFLIDSGKSFIYSEKARKKKDINKKNLFIAYYESIQGSLIGNIIATFLALLLIILGRIFFLKRVFSRRSYNAASKKRIQIYSRNISILLIVASLLVIWSDEFKTVSLYLMAISMAGVLFMREMIKNFHGGFILIGSRAFKIGDIIRVKDTRGQVVDTSLLTTKVSEIGHCNDNGLCENGCLTTIPNSVFLNTPVINESKKKGFIIHSFVCSSKKINDWKKIEKTLLDLSQKINQEYLKKAKDLGVNVNTEEKFLQQSSVNFSLPSPDRIDYSIKVFILAEDQDNIDSRISREILVHLKEKNEDSKS